MAGLRSNYISTQIVTSALGWISSLTPMIPCAPTLMPLRTKLELRQWRKSDRSISNKFSLLSRCGQTNILKQVRELRSAFLLQLSVAFHQPISPSLKLVRFTSSSTTATATGAPRRLTSAIVWRTLTSSAACTLCGLIMRYPSTRRVVFFTSFSTR